MPAGNLAQFDMGQDGRTNATNQPVSTGYNTRTLDAYGYSLNYFAGDYNKISSTAQAPNPFAQITMGAGLATDAGLPSTANTAKDLFNGNISAMAVSIPKLGSAMVYGYNYDQLNRITAMYAYKGIGSSSNTFTTPTVALQAYREKVTYDANGNILTYKRNGDDARLNMDDMTYTYKPNTNQLDKVVDASPDAAASDYDKYNDIKRTQPAAVGSTTGQVNNNYAYDEIGNLIKDLSEGISNISWTVYGKINQINKTDGTIINYTYDASGNRITKLIIPPSGAGSAPTTYYVRDASGNVMAVYTTTPITGPIALAGATATVIQTEIHLYGSSRLGIYNVNRNINTLVAATYSGTISIFTRGNKFFELSNHLENVLVTVSDKRIAIDSDNDGTINYYNADVVTANDYYPFGMTMPNRKFTSSNGYRYGFNGQENSDEIAAGLTTAMYWEYDSRIGRRWNVDPKPQVWESPYLCFSGNPIFYADPNGDIVRGHDRQSLRKALREIRGNFKGKKLREIRKLFKAAKFDDVISKIDKNKYLNAASDALANGNISPQQLALLEGFVSMVNSKGSHTVEYVGRLQKLSFQAQSFGHTGIKNGQDLDAQSGGGQNIATGNDTYSVITKRSKSKQRYLDAAGNLVDRSAVNGDLLAHEMIGHGYSGTTDIASPTSGFQDAIQVSNLVLSARGMTFTDDGGWHGQPTSSRILLTNAQRTSIPIFLQKDLALIQVLAFFKKHPFILR